MKRIKLSWRDNRGATAVIVAICLVMLCGFAALALDVGLLFASRNELQNTADAGALAGAGYLGSRYAELSYSEQQGYTFSETGIVNAVNQVSKKNRAGGISITINAADITIGNWNPETRTVTPTLTMPDAVRVIARRDGSANGPIDSIFARIFGIDTLDVSAVATAALTAVSKVNDGVLKTPFGLSENVFPNDCTEEIVFSPTTNSCAGWHNFFDPANASSMANEMLGFIKSDGTEPTTCLKEPCGQDWFDAHFPDMNSEPTPETTPETFNGDDFNFQGGSIASLFNGDWLDLDYDGGYEGSIVGNGSANKPAPFPALFDYFRYRDGDNDDAQWTSTVPIYKDSEECGNPTGPMEIVGFAEITVKMPNPPPDTSVSVWVACENSYEKARSGGSVAGNLKGTIPSLVE